VGAAEVASVGVAEDHILIAPVDEIVIWSGQECHNNEQAQEDRQQDDERTGPAAALSGGHAVGRVC
jgi:hypothetical protein